MSDTKKRLEERLHEIAGSYMPEGMENQARALVSQVLPIVEEIERERDRERGFKEMAQRKVQENADEINRLAQVVRRMAMERDEARAKLEDIRLCREALEKLDESRASREGGGE